MTQNHTEKICAEEYTVKRGDSFYLIAHKLGVPLRDLLAANRDIHPARLMVGDVLCIPREEDDTPSAGTGTGNAGSSGSSTGSTGGATGSGNTGSPSERKKESPAHAATVKEISEKRSSESSEA